MRNKISTYWLCQIGGWLFYALTMVFFSYIFVKFNALFLKRIALFVILGFLFTHVLRIIIKENKVDIKVGFNIEMMSLVFKVDK